MRPKLPASSVALRRLEAIEQRRIYTNFGPEVSELERRYATFLGTSADRVVTVTNATLGLMGAVSISPAATWLIPSFTFPATPAAVLTAGREVRWGDISLHDFWLETDALEGPPDAIGVLPVAPFGGRVLLDRFDPNRETIIDAAASLGSDIPPLAELPARWAVVFSLHATKVLPAGEGGLVVFGTADRAQRFRTWSNFGFAGTRESQLVGINAKMSEMSAAFAHASLDSWETEQAEWRTAKLRAAEITKESGYQLLPQEQSGVNPYWIVDFGTPPEAQAAEQRLTAAGVETRRWWSHGCARMPAFAAAPTVSLPNSDLVAARTLGLPMFRDIDETHFDIISESLPTPM